MNIQDFDNATVGFTLHKIKHSQCLWFDAEGLGDVFEHTNTDWNEQTVVDQFAYIIKNSTFFEEVECLQDDTVTGFGEKYGGGLHGGGVRCANVNGVQLKGIGQNPLAGHGVNFWHSYGGFSIVEAVVEIIMSDIIGRYLPHGVTKCLGLIKVGDDAALFPNGVTHERGTGVIVVRELCLRPAHFIDSVDFKPKKQYQHLLQTVENRANDNIKRLVELAGGAEGFMALVENFLAVSAKQFAAAKMKRVFHASMCISNIALDGRWLDLTTSSLVDSAYNYQNGSGFPSFHKEHYEPVRIISYLINGFANLGYDAGDKQALFGTYTQQMFASLQQECCLLLGFAKADVGKFVDNKAFEVLFDIIWQKLVSDSAGEGRLTANYTQTDPLAQLFSAICNDQDSDYHHATTAFKELLAVAGNGYPQWSKAAFVNLIKIRLMKPMLFSGFYARMRLEAYLKLTYRDEPSEFFGTVINDCQAVSDWVVVGDELTAQQVLFKTPTLQVKYLAQSNECCITDQDNQYCLSAADTLAFIGQQKDLGRFVIHGYDFLPGLTSLLTFIQ